MARAWRVSCGVAALAVAVAVAMPARWASYWLLRELYRFGEWVGITRGSTLGGQVLGLNFVRPPAWWGFLADVTSFALPLVGVYGAMAFACARLWTWRAGWRRVVLAAAVGAGVAALFYRLLGVWVMSSGLEFFEWCGASAVRLGGPILMGPGGPFHGTTWADVAGNWYTRFSDRLSSVIVGAGVTIGMLRVLRETVVAFACRGCGYDRRGIAAESVCPECGAAAAAAD